MWTVSFVGFAEAPAVVEEADPSTDAAADALQNLAVDS